MSESLLQKQFQEKDLQRARNLISGRCGAATTSQVGYEKVEEEHKEGDIWTDGSGKTWTIEDGIRISVTKLQKARDMAKTPLMCPKCGKPLTSRLDKKMYGFHGVCHDCVLKVERELKLAGLYEQYEQSIMAGNLTGLVKDIQAMIQDQQKNCKVGFVTEQGEVENWGQVGDDVINGLAEWVDIIQTRINSKD